MGGAGQWKWEEGRGDHEGEWESEQFLRCKSGSSQAFSLLLYSITCIYVTFFSTYQILRNKKSNLCRSANTFFLNLNIALSTMKLGNGVPDIFLVGE